nr:GNAT family N-acetyltransferase [Aeromicrobium sp. CFBP 8757]
MQLRAQRAHHAVAHPDARHEILVAEGRDVGRIVVDVSAPETRIVDLVVAREHRRQGIATAALTDVLAEAGERSQPVGLSVWPTNHPALDLYTGLGFEVVVDRGDGTHIEMRREASEPKDRP